MNNIFCVPVQACFVLPACFKDKFRFAVCSFRKIILLFLVEFSRSLCAEVTEKGNIMHSGGSSCPKTQSGVVRVNYIMDSGNSLCSRTRSGLVRGNSTMDSSDGSCSRTRSGLVRGNSFMDSSDGSCLRTRSGLVRGNIFMDSSDGTCSRTRSGLVRGSPPVVKALSKDEAVTKELPDGWMKEDMPVGKSRHLRRSPTVKALIKDEPVTKGLPDGCLKEEMPSRTRSGLVRGSPIVKREDMPVGTQSAFVRGSPATKTLSKDKPVIKGLADGWLKEDRPLGTRSGLVRGNLLLKVEPVTKGQPDGLLKEDKPAGTRSSLVQGSLAVKTLSKDESVIEGLPDGWRKEYRPRKNGSCQKNDPYYIDPVSGYEFRSLKDVHRYLQTGDIKQCATRPKKGTIYDVCITENQTHTSTSSQHTRPSTADKAIQCEILTSEGIMLLSEELFTPYRGKNTEHTKLLESESMNAMQGYGNKLETLEHNSVQPVSAQGAQRQTKYVKRKEQNVEVKFKKRKRRPAATPVRVSPRLAALNVQHEVSIEPEDQPNSVNLVNQVQTIEKNTNDQSQMIQSGTMNQRHGNQESTFNQLWSSQADTAIGMHAMQENTTNHLQPSQVDTVNHIQTNQENTSHELQSMLADTVIPIQTMQEYTTYQPSQADTMNHIQTNQENTAHELQSSLADTVVPIQTMQEYITDQPSQADTMNHIHMNQENTANQLQSSLADIVIPVSATQECTSDYSQPSSADSINQIQANQENTAAQLQLSQADTVTQIQIMQKNMTKQSQLSQADTVSQIHINLENTTNHMQPNYAENPMLQASFSWASEQNGGALITDFWRNVENQDSSVPMQIDGAPVTSFPANVKFQNAASAEPVIPSTQAALPGTASDQSGLAFSSLFGNVWSDPCIEFAFKTLTGDIPVLDDTAAVTGYFPQQLDLNKGTTTPNCSASTFDNTRKRTQVDVNLPLPRPSDKLYNGSWFPPQ